MIIEDKVQGSIQILKIFLEHSQVVLKLMFYSRLSDRKFLKSFVFTSVYNCSRESI